MEIGSIQIIALLVTGVGVGFASGLLGVGGCFIMVPVQFWALTSIGVDSTIAIRIAFGTNLAVVLPTAISGAIGHNRKKAVSWKAGIILGLSGLVGSVVGGYFAAHIPGNILRIGFGLAIIAGGIRMLMAKPLKVEKESIDSGLLYILWGFPLGIVSGIIGIGGGVLMVPVMVLAMKFIMHQAIGTSTALMIFTSIGGILSYTVNGLNVSGLPLYSVGYVNFLQWILLAGTSVPMAQAGVRVAHKLPARQLKYIFIAVMIYMGLKMIGVFTWFHLPI
jgi:uncharacterized membrane protein YfcA